MKAKRRKLPVRVRYYVGPQRNAKHLWTIRRWIPGTGAVAVWQGVRRKSEAMTLARTAARNHDRASVYVAGRDGRYRLEWTYPKASDPRRTKG